MQRTKIMFSILLLILIQQLSIAQTGQWKLAGNSLAGTEKLGSTNNQDVRFISNNVVNGVLTKSGLWGIGTSAPLSKLHVKNGSSGISPFFQSALTTESSDNAYINILSPSAHASGKLPHPNGEISTNYEQSNNMWKASITLPSDIPGYLLWKGKRHELKPGNNSLTLEKTK